MQKLCKSPGCPNPVRALGFCTKHYTRLQRHGSTDAKLVDRGGPSLAIAGILAAQTDACIEWPYARNAKGYGVFSNGTGTRLVSRYVLQVATKTDGRGLIAAHMPGVCHNPACVNPRHLRWATHRENALDRHADGTMPCGDASDKAKLSQEDRNSIASDGRPSRLLSAIYGVSTSHINRIRSGWRTAEVRIMDKPGPAA